MSLQALSSCYVNAVSLCKQYWNEGEALFGFTVNRKVSWNFPCFQAVRDEKALKQCCCGFRFNGKGLTLSTCPLRYPDIYLQTHAQKPSVISGNDFFWTNVAETVKNHLQCKRRRFDPCVKIPWNRKWQPAPIFLPGESHGRMSLVDYSPWGLKESDTAELSNTFNHNVKIQKELNFSWNLLHFFGWPGSSISFKHCVSVSMTKDYFLSQE